MNADNFPLVNSASSSRNSLVFKTVLNSFPLHGSSMNRHIVMCTSQLNHPQLSFHRGSVCVISGDFYIRLCLPNFWGFCGQSPVHLPLGSTFRSRYISLFVTLRALPFLRSFRGVFPLVESREGITPRPSLLNLDVQLSPHPVSDVLSFRFCSCGCSHDSFHGWLEGCFSSSYCG